jgi:hypothetical protein
MRFRFEQGKFGTAANTAPPGPCLMTKYVFAANQSNKEYHRLRLVENAFDDKTQSILLKSGLKAGFSCLEVGPGAGSILKWMKEIVSMVYKENLSLSFAF